jgi:hypothetical protein
VGRPRRVDIPTTVRHCPREGRDTEWRQWRKGVDREGQPRLIWACASCHNETNKQAYWRAKAGDGR